ncbi:hypothetical protein, partial [Actinotalea sp.]|uniref:hypothetical protein n=1 Tax=Actinotalea sp. TaxID=1872145 RepID=UPI003561B154
MDGIASITGRIAEIQGRIAVLSPARPSATSAAGGPSASFESVLAAQLDGTGTTASPTFTTAGATAIGSYGPSQVANAAAIVAA